MTTQPTTRKAYLQHGAWGGPYRTESVELRERDSDYGTRTQTGYGKRLPVGYQVRWEGRWFNVYCVCYSNVGTLYITSRGTDIVVSIDD